MQSILQKYRQRSNERVVEEFSIQEYLELCASEPLAYAQAHERMLEAIGKPRLMDTQADPRLSRIFSNRRINVYDSFGDCYGIEDVIEKIVGFFKHAAQGLEERKQILYLLGPTGACKSSIAEKLKKLMEKNPIYVLKAGDELSPHYESPLSLFDPDDAVDLEAQYKIPARYFGTVLSPWAAKKLKQFSGDITRFTVVKLWPSILNQVAITKTEPGDENNQDISALVGKVDIRKLELYSQNDPDAYSYSGGLNITAQGILEFVEMFKAPIKVLHPLLTATQEGHYNGTEQFGAMPFKGVILAHSNESEWQQFRNNKTNEAFLDRVYIVKVPYCLRVTEEVQIYKKLLSNSSLGGSICAPGTLDMLATFSVMTRLKEPENSQLSAKIEIYDGKSLKETNPNAKSLQEYKDFAGVDEGMNGFSTRSAFKILSRVYNYDAEEVSANPIHLLHVLETQIMQEQYPQDIQDKYIAFIKTWLAPKYAEFIGDEIQKAYLESYSEYGQNIFDRYIQFADMWIQDIDYRDPDTGEMYDRSALNGELEKIEKPGGIANPKDFRNEIVTFVLRAKSHNKGKNPHWTSYEKMRTVIEKKMFANTEELLPIISFSKKASGDDEKKHNDFVQRMTSKGYTEKQVRLAVEWFTRFRKNN